VCFLVTTGGSYESQVAEFRTWMDKKGWYYEVKTKYLPAGDREILCLME